MREPEYDPILVRCPHCKKRFQPNRPMVDELVAFVVEEKLEAECPTHTLPEVIED
jgi:hypothetical protein